MDTTATQPTAGTSTFKLLSAVAQDWLRDNGNNSTTTNSSNNVPFNAKLDMW
jgi:hypothetical protein